MIRALLALTIVTLSAACVANPAQGGDPAAIEAAKRLVPPASPPPSPAGMSDLTGVWVIADEGQRLPVGRIEACDLRQVLVLKQQGDRMTGYRTWFGFIGELPLDGTGEQLEGEVAGSQIARLRGASASFDGETHDVAYEVRFDLTTLHLIGTRNGHPFEAAQLMCPQLGRPEFHPASPL